MKRSAVDALVWRLRALAPARYVHASLALLLAVGVVAAACGAELAWDGASLLFAFLDVQHLSLPHHRGTVALFQFPTLILSRVTSRVGVLELTYGLTYTLVPFVSAWACWRIVRSAQPRLIVWPLLWTGVGALPGQLFFVTECLLALQIAWPLLLLVATPLSWARVVIGVGLATLLFELHPVSAPLLLLAGTTAAARAFGPARRRAPLLVTAAVLVALGLSRGYLSLHDDYEAAQVTVNLRRIFDSLRLPGLGVGAALLIPVCVAAAHLSRSRFRRHLLALSGAALGVFGVTFALYAADPGRWQDALNYRFLAPFAAVPFLAAAAITGVLTRGTAQVQRLSPGDGRVALGGALVFTLVLTIQCLGWLSLRRSLEAHLATARPCTSMRAARACRGTALKWWPTPSYALLIQGRAPRALLLPGRDCASRDLGRVIHVNPWYARPRESGWFDLTRTGLP